MTAFDKHLEKKSFENIVGKGENAGNQHFLLISQSFLSIEQQIKVRVFSGFKVLL